MGYFGENPQLYTFQGCLGSIGNQLKAKEQLIAAVINEKLAALAVEIDFAFTSPNRRFDVVDDYLANTIISVPMGRPVGGLDIEKMVRDALVAQGFHEGNIDVHVAIRETRFLHREFCDITFSV